MSAHFPKGAVIDTGEEKKAGGGSDASAPRRPRSTGAETRERILRVSDDVMGRLGIVNATTKEIARAVGCSEATLYKHFPGKTELFLEVLRHRFPPFAGELSRLHEQVGRGDVRETLIGVVEQAVPFYRHGVPRLGSLFADPDLLRRHREEMTRIGAGPGSVNRLLVEYLAGEQRLGRIGADVVPDAVVALLVGASFQRGFLEAFTEDEGAFPPIGRFAEELVDALLPPH